jgi:hypothetical protein
MPNFPVTTSPAPYTWTDASGTVTAANTAQTILAANAAMIEYRLQNLSLTHSLYFRDSGGNAVILAPGSFGLSPGSGAGTLQAPGGTVQSDAPAGLSVISGLAGHPYSLVWR